MKTRTIALILLLIGTRIGFSQGFVNLDFEAANLAGYSAGIVPAANAFPGWTVTNAVILYDSLSLSGESISIVDANFSSPIQGTYYALLASANYPGTGVPISIGQSGTIPLGMQSMTFWGNIGGMQVTFDGQLLSFNTVGSTANYNIYAADISAYAGVTGQLLFTLPPYTSNAKLDNIQFSTAAVPEPSALALFAGGLCLLWRGRQLFDKS